MALRNNYKNIVANKYLKNVKFKIIKFCFLYKHNLLIDTNLF